MKYRLLGQTGLNVSVLSLGGSSLGGAFGPIDEEEAIRTVHVALDLGINFIDTSPYYGDTRAELVLGKALKGVSRDRYILATKVGQYGAEQFDFSASRVTRSLDESCSRLGVDHVDLLQCHDIEFADVRQIVDETLPALQRLKRAGRIGHVGITGLPLKVLQATVQAAPPGMVETVLSFCHYELNDTSLESLLPFFRQRDVGVINASPTGMGLLTERGVPHWHPAPKKIVDGCRQATEYCRTRGVDIVQLAGQFAVSNPEVATTLVGTASPDHIRRNVAYADSPMDLDLLSAVQAILAPIHNHNFTRGRPENRDPVVT